MRITCLLSGVCLLLIGYGDARSAISFRDLYGADLDNLDAYLRTYILEGIQLNINKTVTKYQNLVYQCAETINATIDQCTACSKKTKCGGQASSAGINVGAILMGQSKLYDFVGDQTKKLTGVLGKSITKITNTAISGSIDVMKNTLSGKYFNDFGNIIGAAMNSVGKIIDGAFSSTANALKGGAKVIGNTAKNTFNAVKDFFGKRSILVRREISKCLLDKCPVCKRVDVPENPSDAQLEALMEDVCSSSYKKQLAAKKELDDLIAKMDYLINNPKLIIDELWYAYDSRKAREGDYNFPVDEMKVHIFGVDKNMKPDSVSINVNDMAEAAKALLPNVYGTSRK